MKVTHGCGQNLIKDKSKINWKKKNVNLNLVKNESLL